MGASDSRTAEPPRVLVVDDEESIRTLVMAALAEGGYELLAAADGEEAKEVIGRERIDAAVVDLQMPRLDGLGLMRWARPRHPDIRWIILSGQGAFEDAVRAVQLGAFDFITKPHGVAEAVQVTVRNALREKRLEAERRRLLRHVEHRNARLAQQVVRLRAACRMLCEQTETINGDLHRAELIQRALLPLEPPPMEGFSVDTLYRPSRIVGGDLYDVVRLDDRHVAIYLADAAGHGVSAAMLAVLFKHRLAMTYHAGEPVMPREALSLVNAALWEECSAPGLFITAAYCLLDMPAATITVASAGHPPLLLQRADGEQEMIFHTGAALGLSAQANYAEKRLVLHDGDRLLLYTDGLREAGEGGNLLRGEQLSPRMADPALAGAALLQALLAAAAASRGEAAQEDDLTMLLLTVGGAASTFDNGKAARIQPGRGRPSASQADVLMGSSPEGTAVSIQGRGTWTYSAPFHEACMQALERGSPLTLDLSFCEHLDSTFLGTIQELTARGEEFGVPIRCQNVRPQVRQLLDELGMDQVIRHIDAEPRPLPGQMLPLEAAAADESVERERVLRAHEVLASLSDRNRREFIGLIEGLRRETPGPTAPAPAPAPPEGPQTP